MCAPDAAKLVEASRSISEHEETNVDTTELLQAFLTAVADNNSPEAQRAAFWLWRALERMGPLPDLDKLGWSKEKSPA